MLWFRARWRLLVAGALGWLRRAVLTPLQAKAALAEHRARDGARTDVILGDLRMSACERCPFYNKGSRTCRKCGCFMPMKVRLPSAKCPIGRW